LVLKFQLAVPKVIGVPEAMLVNEPETLDTVAFQDVTAVAVEAELVLSIAVPPKITDPVIRPPRTTQIFVTASVTAINNPVLKFFIFQSPNS